MTVIARDAVASDHLVYAWPFPIGPDCEVACGDEEQVVMCPAWLVGDRLGPGRHLYRTPDPSRPVGAYFVLLAPVEVQFDMVTMFVVPNTGMPVRLRAVGALQVRCTDPALLIAQFVGLPFDGVNDGILRSVSRSVERMLARLLTRRVVMSGTPLAVTDPSMLGQIMEELVAYNPTAGAVFGIELIRMGHLVVVADDAQTPYLEIPRTNGYHPPVAQPQEITPSHTPRITTPPPMMMQAVEPPPDEQPTPAPRSRPKTPQMIHAVEPQEATLPPGTLAPTLPHQMMAAVSAPPPDDLRATSKGYAPITENLNIPRRQTRTEPPPMPSKPTPRSSPPMSTVSGEINPKMQPSVVVDLPMEAPAPTPAPIKRPASMTAHGMPPAAMVTPTVVVAPAVRPTPPSTTVPSMVAPMPASARTQSATLPPPIPSVPKGKPTVPMPAPRPASPSKPPAPVEVAAEAKATSVTSLPPLKPLSSSLPAKPPSSATAPSTTESRGAILGIGMSSISSGAVAGEIPTKVPPGGRVLVPGPNGLMQSATVRQLLSGYYELEVGSSGETIWVPIGGVVPHD